MGDVEVDIHMFVQPDMSFGETHLISHKVSKILKAEYKDISDVVEHLEPSIQQPQKSNRKKTS